jgi:DNA polymerase IV (archaeal DinB-like DNA polymerase)
MRIVGHLDMDAFFAAVEERDTPRFHGEPIVVGSDPRGGKGRGVVSTANYKARAYGIFSATPISKAWRLSEAAQRQGKPAVVFLSVDMKKYAAVSARIMDSIRRLVPLVEEAGIDEAFVDLSFTGSWPKAEALCREIKREILNQERLTCSIGIGPNKLIAKIASDRHKPDGLTMVQEQQAEEFLAPLSVRKIPGIGPKTEQAFAREGIRLVQDLKQFTRHELQERLGKRGLAVYERIRGRDDTPVLDAYEIKSISEQETFGEDTVDPAIIGNCLGQMCEGLIERLRAEGFAHFRTAVVTVRFADFQTKSRSYTLAQPTDSKAVLEFEALRLLVPFLDSRENPARKLIRLVGLRIEKFHRTKDDRPEASAPRFGMMVSEPVEGSPGEC